LTKAPQDIEGGPRDRPDYIDITPAMIEAGVYAAREHCLGLPLNDLVQAVYVAMRTAAFLSNTVAPSVLYQSFQLGDRQPRDG
jgi:hypothetical protein